MGDTVVGVVIVLAEISPLDLAGDIELWPGTKFPQIGRNSLPLRLVHNQPGDDKISTPRVSQRRGR